MSLGDVHIMMFYGCPENVNLTHSTKFITITLLKYSFSVPLEKQKQSSFSNVLFCDVLGTSPGRQF